MDESSRLETPEAVSQEVQRRQRRIRRRETGLHACLAIVALALCIRLIHLQCLAGEQFASRASRQQTSEETIASRPGDLLDRHGRLLATTISVPSLAADPSRIRDATEFASRLAPVLGTDPRELRSRIEKNADKRFLWLKRRLTAEQADAVRGLSLPKESISIRTEFQRCYPQGALAAHVVGLRNIDGKGQGGAEEAFEHLLRGRDGVRRFVRDARGYVLDILEEVTEPPVDGASVVLTLDVMMQLNVERRLDDLMAKHRPHGACAIVMDPRRGEILALASRPAFDPGHPEGASEADWKNLAVSAVFEPGSTFKPLVVAWGLDHEILRQDEVFNCEFGLYRMGRRRLRDHHPYGKLSLTDVLVKSSNIGMAKMGERMGAEELHRLAVAFGFGRPTGIELPGELPGILRPLDRWNSYSIGSIPMGQELAATPLQLIAAHAVLANDGRNVAPHLLLGTLGQKTPVRQVLTSRVVGSDVARWVVQGPMTDVVVRGTGKQAQIKNVNVFGKTGTAQKAHLDSQGYSDSRHVSSFVCGAPSEDPRLLVLVSVDEPQGADQFGGTVAAPTAAAILERGLEIIGAKPQTAAR